MGSYKIWCPGKQERHWAILGMGVLLGLLGMVTPYFSGQIFDTIIPSADRNQLFQFTVGLIAAAFGTFAFELVKRSQSVGRRKMDYPVQAGIRIASSSAIDLLPRLHRGRPRRPGPRD